MSHKFRPCVGCGYCCRKAFCPAAAERHGLPALNKRYREGLGCPELLWDGKRYWCQLALEDEELGREQLYVGVGCCSPLNTDRKKIRDKSKSITERNK